MSSPKSMLRKWHKPRRLRTKRTLAQTAWFAALTPVVAGAASMCRYHGSSGGDDPGGFRVPAFTAAIQDLSRVVRIAVEGMQAATDKQNVKLTSAVPQGIMAEVDGSKVYWLLVNLIDNAVKYNRGAHLCASALKKLIAVQ